MAPSGGIGSSSGGGSGDIGGDSIMAAAASGGGSKLCRHQVVGDGGRAGVARGAAAARGSSPDGFPNLGPPTAGGAAEGSLEQVVVIELSFLEKNYCRSPLSGAHCFFN